MAKIFRKFRDFEYDDDYESRGAANQFKEHRKDKRLKNALKARNIDELIDMDDEY